MRMDSNSDFWDWIARHFRLALALPVFMLPVNIAHAETPEQAARYIFTKAAKDIFAEYVIYDMKKAFEVRKCTDAILAATSSHWKALADRDGINSENKWQVLPVARLYFRKECTQ